MKKIKNDDLRTVGIVLSLLSLALIAQPIIRLTLDAGFHPYFFNLLHGWFAIIAWIILLIIGLVIIAKTEKLTSEKEKREQRQASGKRKRWF